MPHPVCHVATFTSAIRINCIFTLLERSHEAVNKEKAKVTGRKELTEREKENEAKSKHLKLL